jgi:hypothetical protein
MVIGRKTVENSVFFLLEIPIATDNLQGIETAAFINLNNAK